MPVSSPELCPLPIITPKTVDARGNAVQPLLRPGIFSRGFNPQVPHARMREIAEQVRPLIVKESRGAVTLAVIVALPFFFVPAVMLPGFVTKIGWQVILLAFVVGASGPLVMNIMLRYLLGPKILEVCVREGICGSCAYELRGLEPDPVDGCVVCPECGSAWRPGQSSESDTRSLTP